MFAWRNSSRFVFTSNHGFQLKYKSSIYNEAQFISKNNQKITVNTFQWSLMWEDNRGWIFPLEEVLLWILWMHILARSDGLKLNIFMDFIRFFGLSFWRHPSTAEDPLVSKWCNDTFFQICSNDETNSSTHRIYRGWILFMQIFIFGWRLQESTHA